MTQQPSSWFLFGFTVLFIDGNRQSGRLPSLGRDPELAGKKLYQSLKRQPNVEDVSLVYIGPTEVPKVSP